MFDCGALLSLTWKTAPRNLQSNHLLGVWPRKPQEWGLGPLGKGSVPVRIARRIAAGKLTGLGLRGSFVCLGRLPEPVLGRMLRLAGASTGRDGIENT